MRRLLPAALAIAALSVACTGDPTASGPDVPGKPTAKAPRRPTLSPTAPLMKMASGTDHVDGVLAVWCEQDKRCRRAAGARPVRYLPEKGRGLLLFEASDAPDRAELEVRSSRGKVLRRASLEPGTTMAYQGPSLPDGRYRLVLIAEWPKREGRWLFGLSG